MIFQKNPIGVLIVVLMLLWMRVLGGVSQVTTITVNPEVEHHIFEGWATSLCWWGNIIGNYPEKIRDSIVTLVFDTSLGLGLNIVRYNIGGGENPSHNHMGIGKAIEGFKTSENASYDWNRDKGQQEILFIAVRKIPKEFFIAEAFSNSPPYWMTISGCASGSNDGSENLKSNYYPQFADYLTEVVKYFYEKKGITFRTLEPFNEPSADWWKANGGQEGCHFSRSNQARLIKELYNKLSEKKLPTKISASDENGFNDAVTTWNSFDDQTKSCVYQINTHAYGGTQRKELRNLATKDKKKLWQSEVDGSGAPNPFDEWKHDHNDIVPGIDIAQRIIKDLRELKPDGWVFWQVVESEQTQVSINKNWGCIHADFTGGNRFYLCKKYFAFKQFTSFIRPYSRMIDINSNDAVAFLNQNCTKLIIVSVNPTNNNISLAYNLNNFNEISKKAAIWRTSSSDNCKQLDSIEISENQLKIFLPSKSITTITLNVNYNKVKNRNYELKSKIPVSISYSPKGIIVKNLSNINNYNIIISSMNGKILWNSTLRRGNVFTFKQLSPSIVYLSIYNEKFIFYKKIILF